VLLLLACATPDPGDTASPAVTCDASGPMDDTLTIVDVQALGTHNSYHIEPDTVVDATHTYTQPPLDQQADLGVRAFELDVHLDPEGVFHVLHLPVLDPLSTCDTLGDCIGILRTWSDAHPCHSPFQLWIEPKDDVDGTGDGYVLLDGHIAELDDAITAAWPREQLITPDDVRGDAATLPDAIHEKGWPLLADSRGKMFVSLLDSSDARAEYVGDAPDLAGRVMFANPDTEDDAYAGTFKLDDPIDQAPAIRSAVADGFLATSNVDEAGQPDEDNEARFAAALDDNPHYFASDHVVAQGSDFVATLPGGSPRCNPARIPDGCGPDVIEP
jgi:hypothetical protein